MQGKVLRLTISARPDSGYDANIEIKAMDLLVVNISRALESPEECHALAQHYADLYSVQEIHVSNR